MKIKVVIIGAAFIGLEMAEACLKQKKMSQLSKWKIE